MNCFKNQSELEERARACGERSWCTGSFCKGAAISVPVQLMQNSCLPLHSSCCPSWRNPCPEYHRSNCICAARGTQLVTTAGSDFVPDHWAVIGLVSMGPDYEHLTKLQLSGHSWKQESWHFYVSARAASSQLPVCYLYALNCLSEGLGLHSASRKTVAAQVNRKSPLP